MTLSDSNLRSRYLLVDASNDGVLLTFEPGTELTLGSPRREKEARRCVASLIRRHRFKVSAKGAALTIRISADAAADLSDLLSKIDVALDAFQEERLYPRVVEEVLGITSRERRRWTKDGRLPKSGTGSFRRGQQSIHFAMHPASQIVALSKNPETIAAWRKADEGRSTARL